MFTSSNLLHINIDSIYQVVYPLAAYDGCCVSYEEFVKIAEGYGTNDFPKEEVLLIRNITDAFIFMLQTLNTPVSMDYITEINKIITKERITGGQVRSNKIGLDDLEIIKILKSCNYDLTEYENLESIVPDIPDKHCLDKYVNIPDSEYERMVRNSLLKRHEVYAYDCFMPMIREQYFKKSNIITGAIIVCKIVLRTKLFLVIVKPEHKLDLAVALLDSIYYKEDSYFKRFVIIMTKNRIEAQNKSIPEVIIHGRE